MVNGSQPLNLPFIVPFEKHKCWYRSALDTRH
jgi:hypothetical protein